MREYLFWMTLLMCSWLKWRRHQHTRRRRQLKKLLLRNMPIQRLLDCSGMSLWKGRSDCSLFITTLSFSVIEMGWGMGDQIGKLNGIVYKLHSRTTNDSGSLFFTGPILLLFASFAEWIVGNFFAFIVSYSHRLCISDVKGCSRSSLVEYRSPIHSSIRNHRILFSNR